ncbi:MAG: hypothetical protein APR56_00550 [Methanosaeta sp. SDB]|nr:MAG: hypothetical protein APR56_00550 [Methanosaeta sp. SDB]
MSGLNETVASVQAADISSNLVPEGLSNALASVSSNGFLGLGLFILLLALGAVLHRLNMERTYRNVAATTNGGEIAEEELREEMFSRQGSNFNAAAITAWMLLFAAFAYFYFLTPEIFPRHNYYQAPTLSSGPLGFAAFGLVVLLLTLVVAALIQKEPYGYYELSRKTKVAIMLTVPLLAVSISLSVQQGTIFPQVEPASRIVAFLALFASELALLWPIFADALGGMR